MSKKILEDALNIYTDGSSYHSPRRGGIGIRLITIGSDGNEIIENLEECGYKGATNNQMELFAIIIALEHAFKKYEIIQFAKIAVFTDSQYVVNHFSLAKYTWNKNGWLKASGAPVANAKLWKRLIRIVKKMPRPVEILWVKGHKKDAHNKAVDKLAKQSAKSVLQDPLSNVEVRRKKTNRSVNIGSVEMMGQRISIHIITAEYLDIQKIHKYKYEVISKGSKYRENVDVIYSDILLKPGHNYYVVLNDESRNPRITKLIREL